MTQRLHDQLQWAVAFGVSVAWLAAPYDLNAFICVRAAAFWASCVKKWILCSDLLLLYAANWVLHRELSYPEPESMADMSA